MCVGGLFALSVSSWIGAPITLAVLSVAFLVLLFIEMRIESRELHELRKPPARDMTMPFSPPPPRPNCKTTDNVREALDSAQDITGKIRK